MTTVFYRSCGGTTKAPAPPFDLYRVEASYVPSTPGGGLDLSRVPGGTVSGWDGARWVVATLPPVGHGPGQVCHTKNVAQVGV